MAERRMFAKTIIDSDAFLDMPCSAQCLYFHLAMRADDDGFINNPNKIQRMVSCSADDMRLLAAKQFIIPFDSGIVVIKHWRIHNYIQKDRYKETVYQDEKSLLGVTKNNAYTLSCDGCIHDVSIMDSQVRIGKDRLELGKDREEEENLSSPPAQKYDYDFFRSVYNEVCSNLPPCRTLTEKRKKAIRTFLKDFTVDQWKEICQRSNGSKFLSGGNDRGWKADIDFLLKPDKAAKILEGGYSTGESVESGVGRRELDEDELAAIARMMQEE